MAQEKGWIGTWPQRPRALQRLEGVVLWAEKPLQRLVRTGLLNPLYSTGPVAVILLLIIGASGLYITFFYDFSFDRSYDAVAHMNQLGMSRLMRAVHRYAADIFVITVLLHALRTFFTNRFRRPYWLAWSTGWILLALAVLAGVTGYFLLWDENALLLYLMLLDALARYVPGGEGWAAALAGLGPRRTSWALMLAVFVLHVVAWLTMGILVWLHVRRLQKPQYFPRPFWTPLTFLALLVGALALPAYLLGKATLTSLPGQVRVDLLYLAIVPPWLRGWAGPFLLGSVALLAGLTALPWLTRPPRGEPRVTILEDRCTGCHLCALDCPYKAITMVPREGPYKFLAVVDPEKCVSCSICLGSCDDEALLWADLSPQRAAAQIRQEASQAREAAGGPLVVAFACERHVDQAARPYVGRLVPLAAGQGADTGSVYTFAVRCAGALHPAMLTAALEAGASEVVVVGCPPDDCAHRKGNQWLQERLERERAPRLPKEYVGAPIRTAWVPPNMFAEAIGAPSEARDVWSDLMVGSEKTVRLLPRGGWRPLVWAAVVLTLPLLLWVALAHRPITAYPPDTAAVVLAVDNPTQLLPRNTRPGGVTALRVLFDGQLWLEIPVVTTGQASPRAASVFRIRRVLPGPHTLRVFWADAQGRPVFFLVNETVSLDGREMRWLYLGRY